MLRQRRPLRITKRRTNENDHHQVEFIEKYQSIFDELELTGIDYEATDVLDGEIYARVNYTLTYHSARANEDLIYNSPSRPTASSTAGPSTGRRADFPRYAVGRQPPRGRAAGKPRRDSGLRRALRAECECHHGFPRAKLDSERDEFVNAVAAVPEMECPRTMCARRSEGPQRLR
jgi:hypothetical protein